MTTTITSPVPFADPPWHKASTGHPNITERHRKLQREIREYVETDITPNSLEWEETGVIPETAFKKHAAAGYLAASAYPIPEKYVAGIRLPGGIRPKEWDAFHDMILIDELARCGCLGVVWGINGGATVGVPPLRLYANESQKNKFLAPLLRGEQRHCLAITEPEAGSDVAALETTAEKSSDGLLYVVNGSKKWVTQGLWADYCLAAVRTGGKGVKGISLLLIDLTSKGVSRSKMTNTGVAASGSAFIEFDDVKVPVEQRIGPENEGFKMIMSTFTHERLWVGITALRLARVALEDSYMFALRRETFGHALIENQMIRAKFTRMAGLIETTSSWMEQLVQQSMTVEASDIMFSSSVSLLKIQAGKTLEVVSRESQQILGGLAYSRGGKGGRVEQIGRDVRVLVVSGGSEEILVDMVTKVRLGKARRMIKI